MKNFIDKLKDPTKNKQIEPKSSESSLFDDFCFESFNNYNMIADELQYRIDVNDLTFEEADLINDIAYNRYVIEVSQEEQLRRAGVSQFSSIMKKYRGTRDDKLDFEDKDISELPNKKALKKPEQIKRDEKNAEFLYDGYFGQNHDFGVDEKTSRRTRGETVYTRGGGIGKKSTYDKDTPSMKKAESLLSKYGSTSRQPITADTARKRNLVAGVLTRKLGGFDKDATYWINDSFHGGEREVRKRNSPPGFEPGSIKSKEELEKEGEKGRYTLPDGYILLHKRAEDGLSEIKPGNISSTYARTANGAPAQIHGRGRIYCTIEKKGASYKPGWGRGTHGYMITSPVSKLHFDWEDDDNPHSKVNITDPRKLIGRSVYIETDKPLKCKQLF